jgi:hypothetical protein
MLSEAANAGDITLEILDMTFPPRVRFTQCQTEPRSRVAIPRPADQLLTSAATPPPWLLLKPS